MVSCASKDPIAMVCIVKSEHQVSLLQYGYDLHNDFDAYLIDYYWSGMSVVELLAKISRNPVSIGFLSSCNIIAMVISLD